VCLIRRELHTKGKRIAKEWQRRGGNFRENERKDI